MPREPLPVHPASSATGAGPARQAFPPPAAAQPLPRVGASQPALRAGWLDGLFVTAACALAFLLASTPAHNSDLWLHLASGRALAEGTAPGVDPFASASAGVLWVNHAWLSDLLLYALYQIGDGLALVAAKAVLVAGLAGLFFCFRRRGARAGAAFVAAVLATTALGPWLLLQPALLSLLGVALTLYLLERPFLVDDAGRGRAWRWLLVPLFALWANLDAWFLLGPALVGLYALGEALRRLAGGGTQTGRRREVASLALLTLAGLAACLLTPYHVHTFAWPTPLGLTHAEQAWMGDPLGHGLVVSPFGARLTAPAFVGPGGWAYCLLLAGGAASFFLRGRSLHPGRLPAWLALAALSVYQARAIPFFAAAAGPMLALNLQEWADGVEWTERGRRLLSAARAAGALAALALLVLAWPGWLQPMPYQPRGWAVEPDESLVRLARRLAQRHDDQVLRPDRAALTFSPEVAHYLAWFCPREKGFVDSRWPLFGGAAGDFVQMRRCLLQPGGAGPDPALRPLLDAHGIDRIILYDPDWGRTTRAFQCLLSDGDEWALLDVEGGAALFGRRADAPASAWQPLDLRRAAYDPASDRPAPPAAPRMPRPPGWFDAFWRGRDDRSADRAEAGLYLAYFDWAARPKLPAVDAADLVGSGAGGEPAAGLALRLARLDRDSGPPEALLLAVRAARRALAANPDDAGAYLLLGEAYVRLMGQTREAEWQAALRPLAALRHAQALAALEQAVLLRPDLDRAHELLARLYAEDGQPDRALDHLRARLDLAEREGAADRRRALKADVDAMRAAVDRSEKIYEANTADKTDPSKVFERAGLAARHGLTGKALDMLLESHPAIFGAPGMQLELDLMMRAGRAPEVRDWLEPQHEAALGFARYHSLEAQAAASCGAYAAADAELETLAEPTRQVGVTAEQLAPVRSAVALRAAEAALGRPAPGAGPAGLAAAAFRRFDALRPLGTAADLLRQEADIRVLRGVLALESGDVPAARGHFRAALDLWGGDDAAAAGAGLDFPGRPVAQYETYLLENAGGR